MIQEISHFLNRAKELGITPNFFMSLPYLLLSKVTAVVKDGWIWVEEGGQFVCPPLPLKIPLYPLPNMPIWASFPDDSRQLEYYKFYEKELLDSQYIYDPVHFMNMKGGMWETFRKNCQKLPKKYPREFHYTTLTPNQAELLGSKQLFLEWMGERLDDMEDAEFLAEFGYFSNLPGIHRKYLLFNDEVVAINAWDENYQFINYRLCVVKKDIPFLSEFARWLFYTDGWIHSAGKLVNDGGNLGNIHLANFKQKLNPLRINKIYTLTPINHEKI